MSCGMYFASRIRGRSLGMTLQTRLPWTQLQISGPVPRAYRQFRHVTSQASPAENEGEKAVASDAEVMSQLLSGQLSHHRLESELKDPERAVRVRRLFLETQAASEGRSTAVGQLPINRLDGQQFYTSVLGSNCENVVGFVPLPVGVVGPLLLDGQSLTVPLATTEGALIASTNRGARAITAGGGAVSVLLAEGMTRAPVVQCTDLLQAAKLKAHFECAERLPELQQLFANTSRYGRLQSVSVAIAGRHAYIRFCCSTGDAMGMNMVGKGTNAVLMEVLSSFPGAELIALSGNYCTDKKPAAINWVNGRGKSVACEALSPGAIVRKVLKADPQRVAALNVHKNLVGSALAGSIGGFNAHASNLVTALFLACGAPRARAPAVHPATLPHARPLSYPPSPPVTSRLRPRGPTDCGKHFQDTNERVSLDRKVQRRAGSLCLEGRRTKF
eukprot:6206246-Pleurochrysis_carterae.AAC.6